MGRDVNSGSIGQVGCSTSRSWTIGLDCWKLDAQSSARFNLAMSKAGSGRPTEGARLIPRYRAELVNSSQPQTSMT